MQTLGAFSGGVTHAKGVQLQLTFDAEGEETAKTLSEGANGAVRVLLTLARQTAERDAKCLPVVRVGDGLRRSQHGTGILFRGEATRDTVEKLMKSSPPAPLPRDRK